MQCNEFDQQLQELLDECPDGSVCNDALPAALAEHTAACDECRGLLVSYRTLFAGLAIPAEPVVSHPFVERVLVEANARPPKRSFARVAAPFAVAASVAVIISTAVLTRQNPTTAPTEAPIAAVQQSQTPASAIAAESQQAVSQESAVAYQNLQFEQPSVGTVLNLAGLRPVTFSAQVLETQWSQQPPWMVEVADGLKPVTESMTGTLNALLRVLPGNEAPETLDQGARYDRHLRYDRTA